MLLHADLYVRLFYSFNCPGVMHDAVFSCWLLVFVFSFQSINVMDYSLLVGVDAQKRELVCGIIDYLRQYTWDKQLENWVKFPLSPRTSSQLSSLPKSTKSDSESLSIRISSVFLTIGALRDPQILADFVGWEMMMIVCTQILKS